MNLRAVMWKFDLSQLICMLLAFLASATAQELPTFNVDKNSLTVSGHSSGGFFSTQFHVAYSSQIRGAIIWGGMPDLCFTENGFKCYSEPEVTDVSLLVQKTIDLSLNGSIDSVASLSEARVFIYHGTEDNIVDPQAGFNTLEYYEYFISNTARDLVMIGDIPSQHAVVSDHVGTPCGETDHRLYIENCGYNSVFEGLNHILGGGLNEPIEPGTMTNVLMPFDQNPFLGGDAIGASFHEQGFYYAPPRCTDGIVQCKVHVFFHGCEMGYDDIQTDFIQVVGFMEVAEANDIIVIFPTLVRTFPLPNPDGCWNAFGYLRDLEGGAYATKDAVQMKAVYDMIAKASGL